MEILEEKSLVCGEIWNAESGAFLEAQLFVQLEREIGSGQSVLGI